MADLWHDSDGVTEASLMDDGDGVLELLVNDVQTTAEGAGLTLDRDAVVRLNAATSRWLNAHPRKAPPGL